MPRPRTNPEDHKVPKGVSMHPSDLEYLALVFPTYTISDAVHEAINDSRRLRLDLEGDHA